MTCYDISQLIYFITNNDSYRSIMVRKLNDYLAKYLILTGVDGTARKIETFCMYNDRPIVLDLPSGKRLFKRVCCYERYGALETNKTIIQASSEDFHRFIFDILDGVCDDEEKYSYLLLGEINERVNN